MVASFHLSRFPPRHIPLAMTSTLTGRRFLAATEGLRFLRILGTGRGRSMGVGADLRRWAMFAIWDEDASLDAFLRSGRAEAWTNRAIENWSVRLVPLRHHGSWGGFDPLAGTDEAVDSDPDDEGPVAVLTRARVRIRSWPAFYRAVPAVEDQLSTEPRLLALAGIGELPVGWLGTFSLWSSAATVESFAYGGTPHAGVVARTRSEGWFAEELFARFRPYASTGTWDGADPLTATGRTGGKGS